MPHINNNNNDHKDDSMNIVDETRKRHNPYVDSNISVMDVERTNEGFDRKEKKFKAGSNEGALEEFRQLFFQCLPFMPLSNITAVCATASVPVFVKNEASQFIFANDKFFLFLSEIGSTSPPTNTHELQILFNALFVEDSIVQKYEERIIPTHPGIHSNHKFIQQRCTLPDQQVVIIGLVDIVAD